MMEILGHVAWKFCSNSRELEQLVTKELQEDVSNESSILGLQWDKFDDKITFDISKTCEKILEVLTKRSLIQLIPSVFDSLGLLNPVIVKLKISFLDVCCKKFALDDILPESYLSGFYDIVYDLCKVQKFYLKEFIALKLLKIL